LELKNVKWRDHHGDHFRERINALLLENDQLITSLENVNFDRSIETNQSLYNHDRHYMLVSNSSGTLQPPWYDDSCETLKRQNYSFLRQFRTSNMINKINEERRRSMNLASDLRKYKDKRNELLLNYCQISFIRTSLKKAHL
jgi:hypothetical protein